MKKCSATGCIPVMHRFSQYIFRVYSTHMPGCPCFVIVCCCYCGARDQILSCDPCVLCCRYQSSPSRSLPCPRHDSMVSVTNKQTYEEEGRGEEYLHLVTIYSCNRQNNTPGTFSCRVELGTSSPDEEDEVRCRRRIQEENDNCLVVFRTIP